MKRGWVCMLVVAVVVGQSSFAFARNKRSHRSTPKHPAPAESSYIPGRLASPPVNPPEGPYASALLIDSDRGRVLFAKDPTDLRPPASMVKMMTALLAFEALERGDVRLDDLVVISPAASRTGGSGVALKAGEKLPFEDLLKAMLVASAYGASVAIA